MKEEVLKQAIACDYTAAAMALDFLQPLVILLGLGFIVFRLFEKYVWEA